MVAESREPGGPGDDRRSTGTRLQPGPRGDEVGLGAALRTAWIGYRRRLDAELAAAGFAERSFPDGRVLRLCTRSAEMTISQLGRDLGMSRQGAAKIVSHLRAREFVTLRDSSTDRREKVVIPTPRAAAFLQAHRNAARRIERQLRVEIGPEPFAGLHLLVGALEGQEQPRLRAYLDAGAGAADGAGDGAA